MKELRTVPEEFRDLDDRVLMLGHAKGFLDWADALEAAGLSE